MTTGLALLGMTKLLGMTADFALAY